MDDSVWAFLAPIPISLFSDIESDTPRDWAAAVESMDRKECGGREGEAARGCCDRALMANSALAYGFQVSAWVFDVVDAIVQRQ